MEETKIKDEEKETKALKEKDEKIKKPKQKRNLIIAICAIVMVLAILIFSTIFSIININNEKIITGVKIEGIDVSGLTAEEAKQKIELIYNEKKQNDISLKYEDYEASINLELLEVTYDVDSAIQEAVEIGKDSNIFVNNYNILLALMGKKNVNVEITINEEIAKQKIEDIGTNLPGVIEESDYYIEENNLIVTKGKKGIKIDTDKLLDEIKEKLNNISEKNSYIQIPVVEKEPEPIDIQKIHDEVCKEVQDAYYTKEPFTIHPEVEGIDFSIEEAKKIIEAEDKEEYTIPLTITKPKVTTAQIGSEAFPDVLATFTTRYDASNIDRTTNLRIACQKLNEKVVLAGNTFSYNQTLGERTVAAGYKNGKVYENGEVVDGIGGGICQISSTLYNAVLMANMKVTERRNHQFVTSYVPAGRDATVVYGLTDFKFKNTRTYAIKIKASVSNGIATVSIYGIKEENEYTTSFETKTISTIPFTVKYVDDATLNAGTEKIKQKGANGLISETYMIKSLNGKVVSRELLSRDTYSAMQKIVLKGTKATTNNSNNSSNANNTNKSNENNTNNNTATVNTKPITDNKTNENNKVNNDVNKTTTPSNTTTKTDNKNTVNNKVSK
ncbi:MAG: VanW family protein [Clostridia bacterium]